MSKYSVVGVSRLNGEVKVRFAHDLMYVKGLTKAGNTDIELVTAPSEMTKPELVEFLKTTPLYQTPEFKEAIDDRADMYVKIAASKLPKAAKPAKADKRPKAVKVSKSKEEKLADLKARAAEAAPEAVAE